MMQNYRTPCYTLAETMDILGLRQSELHHAIRSDILKAVLYTKARGMLLFRRDEKDQWIGVATCVYRGHVLVHPSFIKSLLDEPKIRLDKCTVRLLDADGISNWSIDYPFNRPAPHPPLIGWVPLGQDQAIARSRTIAEQQGNWPIGQTRPIGQSTPLYGLAATPLPREYEPFLKSLEIWKEKIKVTQQFEPLLSMTKSPDIMELDFTSNSTFIADDLRIPASEIDHYRSVIAKNEHVTKIDAIVKKAVYDHKNKRNNQLHELVDRILDHQPQIGAKAAWRIIQEDNSRDDKLFDKDNIILDIDNDGLEWRSRHGNESSFKWSSFQPLLARLKKSRGSLSK